VNEHQRRALASLAVGNAVTVEGQLLELELGVPSYDAVRVAAGVEWRPGAVAEEASRPDGP
jgi:hypothetical protein